MSTFRKISDWFRYERLNYYPALAAFERDAALKRLQEYEREERKACQAWLTVARIIIGVFIVFWIVVELVYPAARMLALVVQIPGWVLQFVLHRRINRRVEAKVAAELGDGRLWRCVECGYDLRASEDRCPECGAPVRVIPPDGGACGVGPTQ